MAGEYDAAEIFAADMPEGLGRVLPTSRKGVQDWTVFDSDTERKFAQELEESNEVCVFAHLPLVPLVGTDGTGALVSCCLYCKAIQLYKMNSVN